MSPGQAMIDLAVQDQFERAEQEWLAANTFECVRLAARITRGQCDANKAAGFFSCGKCEGDMGYGKDKVCVECKEVKPVIARGLCGSCYHRAKVTGTLTKYPVIKVSPTPPPVVPVKDQQSHVETPAVKGKLLSLLSEPEETPPGFYLDFTGHTDLLLHLEEITEDINAEVIEMLGLLVAGKLRRVA